MSVSCWSSGQPAVGAAGSRARTIPVGADLLRLYADYLHEEYRELDSDYVFVNLWARPVGQAMSYRSVYDLVLRLRKRTGLDFDPHWLRHTAATRMLRDGVPIEVVSTLLGHASVSTTLDTYGHLTAEDARRVLERAGWSRAVRCGCEPHQPGGRGGRAPGVASKADGRCPARVPRRTAHLRRR